MTHTSDRSSTAPFIIVVIALIVILAAVFLWPKPEPEVAIHPVPVALPTPVLETVTETPPTEVSVPPFEEETFSVAEPIANAEVSELSETTEAFIAPVEVIEPEPTPLDVSDHAVKQTILTLTKVPVLSTLIVNEGILDKVVATILNTAEGKLSANSAVAIAPKANFSTFKQAGKLYIEPASFTRYNVYAQTFADIDNDDILALLAQYKDQLREKFSEIAPPDRNFDTTLIDAINELLDTPIVKLPIEVSTNRAMYQYANPQLEALSPAQKQLLRMGPYNVRLVKRKLRELRGALNDRAG